MKITANLHQDYRSANTGISLVEVLVLVVIITILMVISVSVFSRMSNSAKEVKCLGNIREYGNALLTCIADNGGLPPWNGLGPGDQEGGSTYPNFNGMLIPEYLPERLRCPLATGAERLLSSGFSYGGSAALAQHYPRLQGLPAPLHKVVLVSESYGSVFWSPTHLNMTMYGVSDANAKDDKMKIHEGSVRRPQYHGPATDRGLHLFFLDGHSALVRPSQGNWYQSPTYGDGINEGYFYDRVQFGKMKNGQIQFP